MINQLVTIHGGRIDQWSIIQVILFVPGSQLDICSEAAYSERRSQSVANMKQKQRKGRRISRLFGSDNEEEINSVVSDIPGMYGRSASMVRNRFPPPPFNPAPEPHSEALFLDVSTVCHDPQTGV